MPNYVLFDRIAHQEGTEADGHLQSCCYTSESTGHTQPSNMPKYTEHMQSMPKLISTRKQSMLTLSTMVLVPDFHLHECL